MKKQRIVVKIGSSSLTDKYGALDLGKLSKYVASLVALQQDGHEVVLISSGAVAAGFSRIGYPARPTTMAGKQASAAVGQALLMQHYVEHFFEHGVVAAQLLLTRPDFQNEVQYNNAYATLEELLKHDAVPIINENDTTSVAELTFGDNDMLSALVSGLLKADMLCILTDVDGIYDANPKTNSHAKRYQYLHEIPDELLQMSGESGSHVGTGGMKSKVGAAKTAISLGVDVFIGLGELMDIIVGKGSGTYIGHGSEYEGKVKQWIRLHSTVSGIIQIDAGAERAILHDGKSLLPAGVIAVSGVFNEGDVVCVENEAGKIIAKGQVTLSAPLLQKIQGLKTCKARELGHEKDVVIHRDRLVMLE